MEQTKKNQPERTGKRWENDEEEYILSRVKEGALPYIIAKEVQRTTGGVVSHLREMACEFIENGKPIEEVCTITGLPLFEIEDALKRREFAKQLKLEKRAEPIQKQTRPFFLNKTQETEIDILRDIRDLLQQLVKNTNLVSHNPQQTINDHDQQGRTSIDS
jgi:hypothetical protein